jgi:signal peptidase II
MKKHRLFWLAAIIGLILDRISKELVVQKLAEHETFPILSGIFHFTYVINTGAAFSVFRNGVNWLRWLSLIVSLGLIIFALITPRIRTIEQLGYGFILAGALGNGIDRFVLGYVIDFLDFRLINFPVFNIADICINIGIICLLIASFPSLRTNKKRG